MKMTERIRGQILLISETGQTDMTNCKRVKAIAKESGYTELIKYMDENINGYINYLAYGDETGQRFSRRISMFTKAENRALLVRAEKLVKCLLNAIDGTGEPDKNATEFENELYDLKYAYESIAYKNT